MKRKQRSDKGAKRGAYRTSQMPQFIGSLPPGGRWQLGAFRGHVIVLDASGKHRPYIIVNNELKPLLPQ